MVIETNDANIYERVPEAESNNRLIKERFLISYFRFPYKKTPRIMIRNLAMKMTKNLFFPAKAGFSAHYIPHIILSQSNWYHKKYFQI